jgi:hypothetical protein
LGIEAREIIEDFKEKNESIGEVGEMGERGEIESSSAMPGERAPRRGLKIQDASATVGLFGARPSEDAPLTVSLASESVLASKTTVLPKSAVMIRGRVGSSPSPSTQDPSPLQENLGPEGFVVTRDVMLIGASEDALIR